MSTGGKIVALAALALGAAYVLGYDPFGVFNALQTALTPAEQRLQQALAGLSNATARAQDPTRSAGAGIAGAASAATTAAGAAAGAGIAGGVALALTAGIAAGAAILVWGIVKRGWFRGGEEGIQVNPARDETIDVTATIPFAHVDIDGLPVFPRVPAKQKDGRTVADFEASGIPRAQWSEVRYWSMVKSLAAAGVRGEAASAIIGQLYAADSMAEFEPAAYAYIEALRAGARSQGVAA